MPAARKFSPSAYLRYVARSEGWGVYHSLFGNLTLMDGPGKGLLEAFSGSAAIDEVAAAFPAVPPSTVRSYANDLIIRGFLVPSGCSEYALVEENQTLRRERLQSGYLVRGLQLVLTRRCNYRCSYCFVNLQPESRPIRGMAGEPMTIETAEAAMREVIAVLKRNGNSCLSVEFFGGEPLINWPVIQRILTTFGNEHGGVGIQYSITTNCALVSPEIAELFRHYHVTVTVSVDMPTRVDGVRAATAKNGDRIRRQLSILRDHRNSVTFNSVISKETISHVDGRKLIDFAREFEVGMVGLILDLDLAFYRSSDNRHRAVEILLDTHDYAGRMGIPVVGYWYQIFSQLAGMQAINLRSGHKTCPATGCKVSVEPDGSMFTCTCTSGRIGHVSDLEAVLASKAYADYALRAYRHAPECANCEIEGFCSGVCMGSLENEYQRSDMVDAGACEVFRSVTRELVARAASGEVHELRLERRGP